MSNRLTLTLACNAYDRTAPLTDGTVSPEGIDLRVTHEYPADLFRRQMSGEFQVSEFSLGAYAVMKSRRDPAFVGMPVFLARVFRHGAIYVNVDAGIGSPKDLVGRRMGAEEYQHTANVWARGLLLDEYGIRHDDCEWFFGSLNTPKPHRPTVQLNFAPGFRHRYIAGDQSLDALLVEGKLDAIMAAFPPDSFIARSSRVRRLFPDYRDLEVDYFRRTRIFPIMHVVVIKREIYERDPWIARSLFDAFVRAKAVARERVAFGGTSFVALPWFESYVDEAKRLAGGDPFTYGLDADNRRVLQTYLRYMDEQGLLDGPLAVDDLFVPELRDIQEAK